MNFFSFGKSFHASKTKLLFKLSIFSLFFVILRPHFPAQGVPLDPPPETDGSGTGSPPGAYSPQNRAPPNVPPGRRTAPA